MATRMQQRRGTAAEWTAANPVLAAGEIGYETDTGKFKFGDGTNAWSDLNAFSDASAIIGAAPGTLDTLEELAAAIANDPQFYVDVTANATAIDQLEADLISGTATLNTSIAQTLADAKSYTDDEISTLTGTMDAADITLQDNINSLTTAVNNADSTLQTNIDNLTTAVNNADADLAADILTNANDIAQEILDRATAITDHNAVTTNVHGIADTSLLATTSDVTTAADAAQAAAEATAEAYADSLASNYDAAGTASTAVSTHNSTTTNVHGIADTSVLATDSDVSSAVSTHAAVTTNVHGIADTSVLATDSDVSAAQTAAEGHADGVVATHNSATTNVHGIADTSDLALLSGADQTFSGNITVSGNFTVSGTTTTVSTQDLIVNDPMIYIGEGSTSNTADLGIVGSFDDGTYQHAGIVRDASDNIWKLFKGVTDEPSTTINFAQGSLDDLAVNNIEVAGVVFTDGTQTKVAVPSITPIAEKTAAYTLTSTDEKDTIIEVNSGSAVTLTIPEDSTVNFPVGSTLDVIQTGAGQVTIAGASGSVVVNGTPGTKLRTQWSSVTLLKRAANSWLVFGDTAA